MVSRLIFYHLFFINLNVKIEDLTAVKKEENVDCFHVIDLTNSGDEDIKIDFDKISSDLYKIDLEEAKKNEYRPSFTKIEDN